MTRKTFVPDLKPWQLTGKSLKTSKIQLWRNGVMATVIDRPTACRIVSEGRAFVISEQAINAMSDYPTLALQQGMRHACLRQPETPRRLYALYFRLLRQHGLSSNAAYPSHERYLDAAEMSWRAKEDWLAKDLDERRWWYAAYAGFDEYYGPHAYLHLDPLRLPAPRLYPTLPEMRATVKMNSK